ncbi:MAG TPA: hypothetical protein VHR97_02120 [Candidatus Baltobacteraceae bacterium]|jgi:hypothetical protein|nr:hypothetical protein [Candidatus Baltobacteraceae bacterium]
MKIFGSDRIAAIAFAAGFAWGSCSSGKSSAKYLPEPADGLAMPAAFTFQTIDDPNGRNNRVTGIRRDGKVVGVYGLTRPSYRSFTSRAPAYNRFHRDDYPGAGGTYLTSLSNDKYEAGYVFAPPSSLGVRCGTCGIVHYDRRLPKASTPWGSCTESKAATPRRSRYLRAR